METDYQDIVGRGRGARMKQYDINHITRSIEQEIGISHRLEHSKAGFNQKKIKKSNNSTFVQLYQGFPFSVFDASGLVPP